MSKESKYSISYQDKDIGILEDEGMLFAELYVFDNESYDEYFVTTTATGINNVTELMNYNIQFCDVNNKAIPQSYNKELFEECYEETLKISNKILENRRTKSSG